MSPLLSIFLYFWCGLRKETYFWYKVHDIISLQCFITIFEIMLAWADNREGLYDILTACYSLVLLDDKGYVSEILIQEMKEQDICLMALKYSNSKYDWTEPVRQLTFGLHRIVETVFSQLSE